MDVRSEVARLEVKPELGYAIQYLLSDAVRLLVDKPAEVLVTASHMGKSIFITVSVSIGDRGKVIGRSGRTARSLRIILAAIGKTHGVAIYLTIEGDPDGQRHLMGKAELGS